jgi:GNAT superfamily N-acetyltransferase
VLSVADAPEGYSADRLVYAKDGQIVGAMQITGSPTIGHQVANTYVHPDFRRQGIATALNDFAVKKYGPLARSEGPSEQGQAFRDSLDLEHFSQGLKEKYGLAVLNLYKTSKRRSVRVRTKRLMAAAHSLRRLAKNPARRSLYQKAARFAAKRATLAENRQADDLPQSQLPGESDQEESLQPSGPTPGSSTSSLAQNEPATPSSPSDEPTNV